MSAHEAKAVEQQKPYCLVQCFVPFWNLLVSCKPNPGFFLAILSAICVLKNEHVHQTSKKYTVVCELLLSKELSKNNLYVYKEWHETHQLWVPSIHWWHFSDSQWDTQYNHNLYSSPIWYQMLSMLFVTTSEKSYHIETSLAVIEQYYMVLCHLVPEETRYIFVYYSPSCGTWVFILSLLYSAKATVRDNLLLHLMACLNFKKSFFIINKTVIIITDHSISILQAIYHKIFSLYLRFVLDQYAILFSGQMNNFKNTIYISYIISYITCISKKGYLWHKMIINPSGT